MTRPPKERIIGEQWSQGEGILKLPWGTFWKTFFWKPFTQDAGLYTAVLAIIRTVLIKLLYLMVVAKYTTITTYSCF